MADEAVITEEVKVENINPFGGGAWTEKIPEAKPITEETKPVVGADGKIVEAKAEPVIEVPKDWLKKEFDIEDPAILKAEREELKAIKAAKPTVEEIKWENEQSKQLHELYRTGKWKEANAIIQKQERIEQIVAGEVTKENAADIIKLGLKLSNDRLSDDDVEFQYKQEYVAPKEPVQRTTEEDDDFKDRHDEWKEKVSIIEQKRIVAAKMAIPSLEAAKVKLVLPEIDKPTAKANEPTAAEIESQKKIVENYLAKINSDYSKVEGFKTQVKDESVKLEFPVEFKIPDEEKVAIKGRLEQGLDISSYMDKRWFDEQNNPKVEQIISDLYQLENLDKILSGVANDSATERLKQHRKQTGNVDVKGTNGITQTFDQSQNGDNKVSPFGKDAWSEKPPNLQQN